MTFVYARWCSELASTVGGGTGFTPAMAQCTWMKNDGQQQSYLLGCSLAGYDWDVGSTRDWKSVLQKARYDLLDVANVTRDGTYNFIRSPSIAKNGDGGTRFGNCAETYAFATWFR